MFPGNSRKRRSALLHASAIFLEALEPRRLLTVTLASSAEDFVNSIGVNAGGASVSTINALTSEIGINNIRGAMVGANDPGIVMVHPYLEPDNTGYVDTSLAAIDSQLASIESTYTRAEVEAVEGPDEYDSTIQYHSGDDPNWSATIRLFDQEMQQQMRADSWFNGIPYIGTSMAYDWDYPAVGNESGFVDGGNAHDYPGTANPQPAEENWFIEDSNYATGSLPIWSTETGYQTGTASGDIDTTIEGRYYPRLFLDSFNAGYYRTFGFDLVDASDPGPYGIVESDGVTLKPAGIAMENLISILKDPQSSTFYAGGLNYTMSGDTTNVDTTLLEKANGTFYLCLWQEIPSTDALAPSQNVTLQFNTPVNSTAYKYTPNTSATGTQVSVSSGSITVGVTDQVTILQITPTSTPTAPAAPTNVAVAAAGSATRATISWSSVSNTDGYIIQRLNLDDNWYTIGTTTTATSFTDVNLAPGDSYSYRVIAVNRGGGTLSSAIAYTAPTANTLIDTLANFNLTTGNDGNWSIAAGDAGTNYSPFVASHPNVTSDSLTYYYQGITDFQATVYMKDNWPDTEAAFYSSSNGVNWTPINVTNATTGTVPGYGYNVVFANPTAALPSGTNYLKVTLTAGGGWPDGYIGLGSMKITYSPPKQQVNLAAAYNRAGIYTWVRTFASNGGLDGAGDAYSYQQMNGWTLGWNDAYFTLGTAGVNDVVSCSGQTINLTAGHYTQLDLLATGVNGNQTSQTFTVNYTDGTHQTFTQSLSSWLTPQSYSGESTVSSMTAYNLHGGTSQTTDCYLYGYTFTLNSAKTVQSLTLPNNSNDIVLAADLDILTVPAAAANLAYTTQPTGGAAGTTLTPIVVTIEDQYGNVEYNDNSAVALSIATAPSGGGFTAGSTTTVNAVNGVATFSNLALTTPGAYTLAAADSTDSLSNFASKSISVTPSTAFTLVFTTQPTGGAVGATMPPLTVTIEDQYGDIETGDNTSVALTIASGPIGGGFTAGSTTTVNAVNGVATFSNLVLNTAGNYTLAAADSTDGLSNFTSNSFTVNQLATQVGATLDVNLNAAGPVAISASGSNIIVNQNGSQLTFTGITAVTITDTASNDVLNFNGPLALPFTFVNCGTSTLNVNSATLTFAAVMGGSINLGTLSVSNGAAAILTAATTQSPTTLNVNSLSIAANGVLDMTNNEMIVAYGVSDPIATISGYLTSGYNNGHWNGPGIISSSVYGLTYALGYADGADGVVAGLSSGQIEVKYTLVGDANLDGIVNGIDFGILSANYGKSVTSWDQGDFNYDGVVNGIDFGELSANYGQGLSIAAAAPAVVSTVQTAAPKPLTVSEPVIRKAANSKPKASPAATYAASLMSAGSVGSAATSQKINKDAKFLADR